MDTIIQHIPTDRPDGPFYEKGTVIQLPTGQKYRRSEITGNWEYLEEQQEASKCQS